MHPAIYRCVPLLLAAALLAGCSDEPTPEERAAEAARELALVEKGNSALPPPEEISLEPISYADIERHGLSGVGCNFAPGTSFATRVIARRLDAYMKVNGDIVRLAADSGASELPAGTRSRYLGRTHELRLRMSQEGDGKSSGSGAATDYQGTVTVLDEYGRLVYEGTGLARCDG